MKSNLSAVLLVLILGTPARAETVRVPAGADLQSAINAAKCGDVLKLEAGATFIGNFRFPSITACEQPITMTSSADLPTRRITPADAALLPTIRSGNALPAITAIGAAGWTVRGVRFEPTTNGNSNLIELQDVSHVTLDQVLFVAPPEVGQRRAIMGNGQHVTLTRSHIAGVWAKSLQDSQAFCAWDGAGPYTITDNYLEAASENVMFGGANSKSADRIPADILVEGNHMSKPLAWKGQRRAVKNLFELKSAKRVVIRNNLFEHNWTDAQVGWGIVLTVRNDEGGAPWSVVEDVLFEQNVIRDTEQGFNILGYDLYHPSGRLTRVTLRNNIVQTPGAAVQIAGEVGELTIDHNTFDNRGPGEAAFMKLQAGGIRVASEGGAVREAKYAVEKLTVTNNLGYHRDYGVIGDSWTIGMPSLERYAPGYVWQQNVLAGPTGHKYPAGTLRPSVEEHTAQFTADYSLIPTSTYRGKATDGTDLGAVLVAPEPEPEPDPIVALEARVASLEADNAALKDQQAKLLAGQDLLLARIAQLETWLEEIRAHLLKVPAKK